MINHRALTFDGGELTPGRNVDSVDVAAGLAMATQAGYGDAESQMVIDYCLGRWGKGEEALAEKTALSHGVDFTSWRMCVAAAVTAAGAAS